MEKCPVCGNLFKQLHSHLSTCSDEEHVKYINIVSERIDWFLLNSTYYMNEIPKVIMENDGLYCYSSLVHKRELEICPGRGYKVMGLRRRGNNNPVFKDGVIEKISNTVAKKWEHGVYENRQNGMLDKKGVDHPEFNVYTFLKWKYKEIYNYYHNDNKCLIHGCDKEVENVHHIDENHDNFMLTNLEGYCVFHHMDRHYAARKTPYTEITKIITFDSCHNLLNYNGKCRNLHGHTYKLEITVRNRVDLHSGMVMDFGTLKNIINKYVIEPLDHKYLNDELPEFNPTAEVMCDWIWRQLEFEGKLKGLYEVKLWETPNSNASVNQMGMFLSPLYAMALYDELTQHYKWDNNA